MVTTVGVRELRQQVSAVLERVVGGAVVEITHRGRPIARIVPLRPSALDQLVVEGRATEVSGDLLDVMEELQLPRPATPGTRLPSHALAEARSDER
ncbi:MAG TPA: type II toxin-antitoxin system prevent-host-death family antitoxin [Candidatus Micrarchaeia archaeon]|nr:type II toxin-antitoxin system prevent-host-death family antitoxin [Candidatus Micrarchaeia archaeon]